jgi:uncharacterized protein (TIGR00645 family)
MSPTLIARILFASRWLLTPFYVGLVVSLVGLLYKGAYHVYEIVQALPSSGEDDVILGALSIIDLTLTASLVVLVIFSGFANFVARVDVEEHRDWPHWMVGIDFGELKLKLMASITAIAAIKLLESYMNVGHVSDRDLMFQMGLFGLFVVAALILAIAERVGDKPDAHGH